MKAYPILTIECPSQAGGATRAKDILTQTICQVGGLNLKEFNALCVMDTIDNQVCLLIINEETAQRVRRWKTHMTTIIHAHKRKRQVSGYMFHSAHRLRTV